MSRESQLALPGLESLNVEWVWTEEQSEVNVVESFAHTTVMRSEIATALAPKDNGVYVDATAGGGGHTEALLDASARAVVVAFDRDEEAVEATKKRLQRFGQRVIVVRSSFARLVPELAALGIDRVDGLCADLGVSSPQLDDPERGMSFRREGPLDMRMDRGSGETARELVARLSDDELADVIYRYGDERRSRRIARSIKKALADDALETTLDLRRAIVRAVGPVRVGGVDPATRTFQALRIAVNGELDELAALLDQAKAVVVPGGVAAFLSFHSLEDRLVKHAFFDRASWTPMWKKPLLPTEEERTVNPRARSAKLRAATRREPSAEPLTDETGGP